MYRYKFPKETPALWKTIKIYRTVCYFSPVC